VLYLYGALASVLGSAGQAFGSVNSMNQRISSLDAQKGTTKVQAARDLRDLKREGASFLSRTRHFIAGSGAAGTASETSLLSAATGEYARGGARIRQDRDLKVTSLNMAKKNLKIARDLTIFNSVAGIFGGVLSNPPPSDTPQADITPALPSPSGKSLLYREPGVSSRTNIGTSKSGGIGGF